MNLYTNKKIGEGLIGTVYEGLIDNKKCIIKIEKYDGDLNTSSSYIRQIIFDNEISKKYPDKFLTLQFSGIKEFCSHKQTIPSKLKDKEFKKSLIEKNNLTKCSILAYTPILKYTLQEKIDNIPNPIDALYQLIETLNILKKFGYSHKDIWNKNIMCSEDMKKWFLIDYGLISHDKFEKNYDDKRRYNHPRDIYMLLWAFFKTSIIDKIEFRLKFPKFEIFIKNLNSNVSDKKDIIKLLPDSGTKSDKIESFVLIMAILHYDIFVKSMGDDFTKFEKLYAKNKQIIPTNIFLYCIKHSCDKDYNLILRFLKSHMK